MYRTTTQGQRGEARWRLRGSGLPLGLIALVLTLPSCSKTTNRNPTEEGGAELDADPGDANPTDSTGGTGASSDETLPDTDTSTKPDPDTIPDNNTDPEVALDPNLIGPATPTPPSVAEGTIFVAPDGNDDTGNGSIGTPYATPGAAFSHAGPGDVIMMRGGTYALTNYQNFMPQVSGTARSPVTVMSYPGEWAVLDFASAAGSQRVWMEDTHWNVVRDLEIVNSKAQGIFISAGSSHNLFVNVVVRNPNGSGIQIFEGSDNRFFECLVVFSYGSADEPGDADGLNSGGRGGPSERNEFYRSIVMNAPDDGYDTWESRYSVIEGCYAFNAGVYGGNGNGFKCGPGPGAPNSIWDPPAAPEDRFQAEVLVRKNVAIGCASGGFDGNSGAGSVFDNNTAYNCGAGVAVYAHADNMNGRMNTLRNNLVYECGDNYLDYAEEFTNSWNDPPNISTGDADFLSLRVPTAADFDGLTGSQAYALLTTGAFGDLLKPSATASFLDVGIEVSLPFRSTAPDLGAYER